MIKRCIARLAAIVCLLVAVPAFAAVSAEFTTGGIAEYSGPNANQNSNVQDFNTLGISKIVMSQGGSTWGGTQGNDTQVTLTIYFTDSTSFQLAGVLNWQLNDGGQTIPVSYFGVTTATVVPDADDRYTRSSATMQKTYILVLPSKVTSSNFAGLVASDSTDGSANFNSAAIFKALSIEFNAPNEAPSFTSTNATNADGSAAYSFSYDENQVEGAVVGTVEASDPEGGALTFAIDSGNSDGLYTIDATTGKISLTALGASSLANDFEQLANSRTLVVSVSDGTNTTTIEVKLNETNLNDNAPAFTNTNATDDADKASYNFDYDENSAAGALLGTVTASDADGGSLSFSIVSGNDNGWYALDSSTGKITLTADGAASLANDFEQDPNAQILTIEVSDGTRKTQIQVKLSELNADDVPPAIVGPSGSPGAAEAAIEVNEGQILVTKVSANKSVTWEITGGNEAGKFEIAEDGTITFILPPDFENPTDGDTNNTYVLEITATDESGNTSKQTITVTVLNIDDTAPVITGPSGGAGAANSALTMNEGLTAITTFTANETVRWSIDGGADAAKFAIDPDTGAVTFLSAPDYENPSDSDRNNTYVVRIKAVDDAGLISYQTFTVTILNVDEIARKLGEIDNKLRSGLRTYAGHGLSDLLSFNETLMRNDEGDACGAGAKKPLSGSLQANQNGGSLDLSYMQRLSECQRRHQVFVDAGLTYSRLGGNWTTRTFGALRIETKLEEGLTVGAGVLLSRANDEIIGFTNSAISDKSLQFNLYARYRLGDSLRTGAFAALGRTWYDFNLLEGDGFRLNGSMTGKRKAYGWMLSGDVDVGGTTITTDAIISRAEENLGDARVAAEYLGENRNGIVFAVGSVDVTRISVPLTAPVQLLGNAEELGSSARLLLSPGLLCEDNDVDSSAMRCGYQLGAKFVANDHGRNRFYADYRWESVGGGRRSLIALGYGYRFGKKGEPELAFEATHGAVTRREQDYRAMVRLTVSR